MFENKKYADKENCQRSLLIIIATKFNIKKTKLQWRMTIPLVGLNFDLNLSEEEFFMTKNPYIRAGCKDIWNAFMVCGANFSANDIPICPTIVKNIPKYLISYTQAKTIFNKRKKAGDKDFFENAFVHFYIDDYKFDGKSGIWVGYGKSEEILQHFAGIITPDFSTCADFPEPLKVYNTYRMRAFGYWHGKILGGAVINNVRWGTPETFKYCFDGIEKNSIVSIGTVASNLKNPQNRKIFSAGFEKMLEVLNPHTIIVYGSDKYPCFDDVREKIKIVRFRSETDLALRG